MNNVLNLRHPDYKSTKVTAPAGGYTAGMLAIVGTLAGVIVEAAAEGATAVLIYACQKIVLPKAAGALAVGDRLYLDEDNQCMTSTPPAGFLGHVAVCTEAAGASATTVECDLFGIPTIDASIAGS